MSIVSQIRIEQKFENLNRESHRLEPLYRRKLQHLADLKQSILHKAFSCELTAREAVA